MGSVEVDVAVVGVTILGVKSVEPEDAGEDRVG